MEGGEDFSCPVKRDVRDDAGIPGFAPHQVAERDSQKGMRSGDSGVQIDVVGSRALGAMKHQDSGE